MYFKKINNIRKILLIFSIVNVLTLLTENFFYSIPYVDTPSIIVKKHLTRLDLNLQIAFKGQNFNKKLFTKLKDPLEPMFWSGCKISCQDYSSLIGW